MGIYRRKIIAGMMAVFAVVVLVAGCGEQSAAGFKKLTGDWAAGLLFPETDSDIIEPSFSNTFLIAAEVKEGEANTGTIKIFDRSSSKEMRQVNFSPSMTHNLYDIPFVYDPDTETLQGEVVVANEDGTSERTTVSLIAFEMEDGSNTIMNGTIEMELYDKDGGSIWLTTCNINAYKDEVEDTEGLTQAL